MSVVEVALCPVRGESVVSHSFFHDLLDSSILIYLSVSGSVMPMRVLRSDSIASVKLRIQTCKGFVVKKQKLVYEGRELAHNDTLVRDYGVTDGNVLHLVLRISNLRAICVKTTSGKEYEFHVERCRNVGYMKKQIAEKEEDLDGKDQELTCYGQNLEDQCLIDDICKYNDSVIHLVVKKSAKVRSRPVDKDFELTIIASSLSETRNDVVEVVEDGKMCRKNDNDLRSFTIKSSNSGVCLEPVIVNDKVELSSAIMEMIDSIYAGLEKGNQPIRSSEGSGGVCFMKDPFDYKFVSVFKPIYEEPMVVNNPHGLPLSLDGEGLKKGTRVGEGALRKVASYILNYPKSERQSFSNEEMGFSGVPPTTMVRCLHSTFNHSEGNEFSTNNNNNIKIGSLQKFMTNNGSCEDMGPQAFPVQEVHKIFVLDMRLANSDRHVGNILIKKDQEDGRIVLIPIDHEYCLPNNFEDCTFDWLYWPQARQPFNSETIDYIKSLDVEEDIALLKFYGWDLQFECARILRISIMLLKKGAERGLTPFAIGSIMCRETLKKKFVIEEIVCEAQDSILPKTSEAVFLESVSQIMDRCLDEISI